VTVTELEPITFEEANPIQRGVRRLVSTAPGAWIFSRVADHLDRPIYRMTNGRRTVASMVAGLPMVMLTTTGAKSGKPRVAPLLGVPTDRGLAVIASNFGQGNQPAWYYNLRKNPDAEVAIRDRVRKVRALEVEGDERERIWDEAVKIHPGYAAYERRAAHRRIHVFVLVPVAADEEPSAE